MLWNNKSFIREKEMEYIACEFYKIRKYFYDAADKKSKKHNKIVIKRLSDLVIKFLFSFHKVFLS